MERSKLKDHHGLQIKPVPWRAAKPWVICKLRDHVRTVLVMMWTSLFCVESLLHYNWATQPLGIAEEAKTTQVRRSGNQRPCDFTFATRTCLRSCPKECPSPSVNLPYCTLQKGIMQYSGAPVSHDPASLQGDWRVENLHDDDKQHWWDGIALAKAPCMCDSPTRPAVH